MTNTKAQCPACGATFDSATQNGCPSCQLKLGLSDHATSAPKVQFMDPQELSQRFDDLEVLELIGAGGMGAVYKVRQTKLDRIVALKVVRADISDSDEFSQRFEREAKAMARLNHPNIVSIYDFGCKDGLFYYVMEFVDGPDLSELARCEELSANESLEIVTQVCKAMQYAHENGVVHRDIKPTNILLNSEGVVKIADFGLAKLCAPNDPTTHLTQTQQVFGTPRYMAPEQIEATREVDHRADIYSLGVVFYELLTGELPLGRFDPPSKKIEIDVKLDEIVLRALEKHPERRYQAARDFQTDISRFSGQQPVPPIKNQPQATREFLSTEPQIAQPSIAVPLLIIPGAIASGIGIYLLSCAIVPQFFGSSFFTKISDDDFFAAFIVSLVGVTLLLIGYTVRHKTLPESIKQKIGNTSPVRKIFTFRVISYLGVLLALVCTTLPWFKFGGYDGMTTVLGEDFWVASVLATTCIVCLAILVFIDIYEGAKIHFSICVIIFGIIMLASAVSILMEKPRTFIPKEMQYRNPGDLNFTMHSAAPNILQVLGGAMIFLGIYGLVLSLIAHVGQLPGIAGAARRKLLEWRIAFLTWRRNRKEQSRDSERNPPY